MQLVHAWRPDIGKHLFFLVDDPGCPGQLGRSQTHNHWDLIPMPHQLSYPIWVLTC